MMESIRDLTKTKMKYLNCTVSGFGKALVTYLIYDVF